MARREHNCEWKERHEALAAEHAHLVTQHRNLAESLSSLQHDMEKLKRHFLGPKSEKMPRVADELRKEAKPDPEDAKRARAERAAALSDNVSETASTPEEFTVQGDGVVSHVSVYQS